MTDKEHNQNLPQRHSGAQDDGKQDSAKTSGPERTAGGGRIVGGVALILSLMVAAGAAGGGYYLYQQLQQVTGIAESRASSEALQSLSDRLDERASALQDKLDSLSQRASSQTENLAQFREQLQALRQDQHGLEKRVDHLAELAESHRYEWTRSEAAYLASVAETRLKLRGDVDSALQALKEADKLLAGFGGRTVDARQGVNKAIDALLAVEEPDLNGLSQRLQGLSASVEDLPLRGAVRTGAESGGTAQQQGASDGGWRARLERAWQRFVDSISQLVVVERVENQPPLLAPDQRYFLTQNLQLQLEAARTALLRQQPRLYRDSLQQAEQWLGRYYDTDRTAVQAAREELHSLAKARIQAELPDIGPMLKPLTGN